MPAPSLARARSGVWALASDDANGYRSQSLRASEGVMVTGLVLVGRAVVFGSTAGIAAVQVDGIEIDWLLRESVDILIVLRDGALAASGGRGVFGLELASVTRWELGDLVAVALASISGGNQLAVALATKEMVLVDSATGAQLSKVSLNLQPAHLLAFPQSCVVAALADADCKDEDSDGVVEDAQRTPSLRRAASSTSAALSGEEVVVFSLRQQGVKAQVEGGIASRAQVASLPRCRCVAVSRGLAVCARSSGAVLFVPAPAGDAWGNGADADMGDDCNDSDWGVGVLEHRVAEGVVGLATEPWLGERDRALVLLVCAGGEMYLFDALPSCSVRGPAVVVRRRQLCGPSTPERCIQVVNVAPTQHNGSPMGYTITAGVSACRTYLCATMAEGEIGRYPVSNGATTECASASSAKCPSPPPSPPAAEIGLPPLEVSRRPLPEPPEAKRARDAPTPKRGSMRRTVSNPTLRRARGPSAPLVPGVGTRCDVVFDRATQSAGVKATGQLRSAPAFRSDPPAPDSAPPSDWSHAARPAPGVPSGPRDPPSSLSAASFLGTCPGWVAHRPPASANVRGPSRTLDSWGPSVGFSSPPTVGQLRTGNGGHPRVSSVSIGQMTHVARHLSTGVPGRGLSGHCRSAPRLLPSM
mmetsp:Transcript_45551/g.120340  ORF Transcript_45551/g.120340 Transcript_45551/m.120340 type:complete len:643 (+) Transcript_45551:26-1954(+)